MRRPRVVMSLIAALGLASAGCAGDGGGADPDVDYGKLGTPVPRPSAAYKTPEPPGKPPGENANPTQQILHDLRQRVVRTAGIPIETTARCGGGVITGTVDQTVTCTVDYRGLKVSYRVVITGGTPTFSWVATTEQSLLTAQGVGLAYWAAHGAEASVVRCDPMPEQKLVPIGEKSGYRCYHKAGDAWHEHAVVLKDGGMSFVEPRG